MIKKNEYELNDKQRVIIFLFSPYDNIISSNLKYHMCLLHCLVGTEHPGLLEVLCTSTIRINCKWVEGKVELQA